MTYDFSDLKTPCYVLDKRLLEKNLLILDDVQKRSGCKILLALKGFSMHEVFAQVGKYLYGVTASSLFEARLGREKMGKQVHICAPAYRDDEIEQILNYCDHVVFNSFDQYNKFKDKLKNHSRNIECGIRINPEYSEIKTKIYDPCFEYSRFGVTYDNFDETQIDGLDGIHFHAMCEQNSDTLVNIIKVVEEKFGKYLYKMKWINFGGGHHITRQDYDVDLLVKTIKNFKEKYDIDVYLEPGEAIPLNAGFLVASVLDIVSNGMDIAILDASAACHMPDVLEMPYRPEVIGAGTYDKYKYKYRFGGNTCLAGDIIGDYSFEQPLKIGDKLVFCDMGHYTMVKNNMFNGLNLPSIATIDDDGVVVIREFEYGDYKNRLS